MLKFLIPAYMLIFVLITGTASAATYYVDNVYGKDYNSGTSSSSPWKTIAKINSRTFKPGDKILFKRGSVWTETLHVKQNGTSSYPITYGSYGSGNLPVIDGSSSRSYGIYMDGRYYIVIRDFYIRNTTHSGIRMKRSKYVTFMNSQIYITTRAGVFIEESYKCQILKNNLTTTTYANNQTDGIYAQKNSYNIYSGNNIVISNSHSTMHCDALQTYLETSATIKDNYVEQKNTKTGEAQGIYCSQSYGTVKIYNNVAYGMYTGSSMIKFKNSSTSGKSQIIGNTIYGGKSGLVQANDPYMIFRNNIVVTTGNNAVVNFEKTLSPSNVSYNMYRRGGTGSTIVIYRGSGYSLSKWKSYGFGSGSLQGDPKFVSISSRDFRLQSYSPALNKGVNMSSPYNVDMLGTSRPYASRSDMGAYEMKITAKEDGFSGNETTFSAAPEVFELTQNYPNPFNPSTTIKFSLPENSIVTLKVYDITGSEVAVLVDEAMNAGFHQVAFDASKLASGTYVYRLTAKDFVQTKKMMLVK